MLDALTINNLEGSRRERKKIEYRNKIILAAINLFSSKGFEATSIAEIMSLADLGVGTFYNYFSSKDDMIIYLSEELNGKLKNAILNNSNNFTNSLEEITKIFEILGTELEVNKVFTKVVYLEMLRLPMFLEIISRQQKWLVDLFANIINSGLKNNFICPTIPSEKIVKLLIGIYMQAVYFWLENDKENLTSVLTFDLDIILKGIKK